MDVGRPICRLGREYVKTWKPATIGVEGIMRTLGKHYWLEDGRVGVELSVGGRSSVADSNYQRE